jgi:tyrosine-protein phosphatase YwqE
MIDDNFEVLLEDGAIMPLRKDYLLVEMSFLQPPINFDQSINNIAAKRYFPILAHPERYIFLQKRMGKYKSYKRKGILYQMNMLSLGEYYGKEVQQTAYKLLDEGLIDFLGSDVHNIQQLNALREIKISNKYVNRLLPIIEGTISSFY